MLNISVSSICGHGMCDCVRHPQDQEGLYILDPKPENEVVATQWRNERSTMTKISRSLIRAVTRITLFPNIVELPCGMIRLRPAPAPTDR
jgi:hypothetical protein